MKGKVEEKLECLVSEGIYEPTQFADWAAPIVPVVKSDGKSRQICGDLKLTVNQASKHDRHNWSHHYIRGVANPTLDVVWCGNGSALPCREVVQAPL